MNVAPMHRCTRTDSGILIGCAYQPPMPAADADAQDIQSAMIDDSDEQFYKLLEWSAYLFVLVASVVASAFYPGVWFT